MLSGFAASSALSPHCASSNPSAAPSTVSTMSFGDELSKDATASPRRARSGSANSLCRASARTSSRLATFAQAMSSTSTTAP